MLTTNEIESRLEVLVANNFEMDFSAFASDSTPSLLSILGNSIHHYKGADLSDPLALQECGDAFYDMRYVGPVFAIHALICLGPQSAERREQQMEKNASKERSMRRTLATFTIKDLMRTQRDLTMLGLT